MNIKRRGFLLGLLGIFTGCLPPLKPHRKRPPSCEVVPPYKAMKQTLAPSCEHLYWYRGYGADLVLVGEGIDYDGQIKPIAGLKYIVKPNTQFKGFVYVNRG